MAAEQQQQQQQQNVGQYSSYSIASLSAAGGDRKQFSADSISLGQKSKVSENYNISMGNNGLGSQVTSASAIGGQQSTLLSSNLSSAQLQESLQQQLMPNSYVSALDNLPTTIFS